MNRRTVLRTTGFAGVAMTALAGCSSPDEGGEGTEEALGTETGAGGDTGTSGGAGTETRTEAGTEPEAETGTGEGTAGETETETAGDTGTGTENGTATDSGTGTDADGAEASYEFLGRVDAWVGRAPPEIEGEENPTLELQAGQEYELTWINDDGQPHDFTIQDGNGGTLEQSELIESEGKDTTFTFTASEEMARYVCTVHPEEAVGDVETGA